MTTAVPLRCTTCLSRLLGTEHRWPVRMTTPHSGVSLQPRDRLGPTVQGKCLARSPEITGWGHSYSSLNTWLVSITCNYCIHPY